MRIRAWIGDRMLETDEDRTTDIEVELRPARAPGFAAIVSLQGEHDISTSSRLGDLLVLNRGSLLIDLSACEFVDSSVLSVLVGATLERAHLGERLELLVPSENVRVTRTLEISSLGEVLTCHASLETV
jgi:anti-anti-sigma factor